MEDTAQDTNQEFPLQGGQSSDAAHELYGHKVALCDLGLLDRGSQAIDSDYLAPGMME